jgi:hypothetical protein
MQSMSVRLWLNSVGLPELRVSSYENKGKQMKVIDLPTSIKSTTDSVSLCIVMSHISGHHRIMEAARGALVMMVLEMGSTGHLDAHIGVAS